MCIYRIKAYFFEKQKINPIQTTPMQTMSIQTASTQYTVMRFSDLKETSTDTTADSIFEKFR